MTWIDPQKDALSLAQQVFTIAATLIGIAAARRWQKELRGRTHHEAAQKAIKEVFNVRSNIAVARRSWRTVFFTQNPANLRHPGTVAEYERLAGAEKSYWEAHLSQIEAAGIALRNESILAEEIWGEPYVDAVEKLKTTIDEWTNAISKRLENIALFLQTLHPDYLNHFWSPILISDQQFTVDYFREDEIDKLKEESLAYWKRLDTACKAVKAVVDKGWFR